ncbi:MAG: hypothetical protein AAGU15_05010 [Anaerolineaceae bacterium]|jgi:hypothetical protein
MKKILRLILFSCIFILISTGCEPILTPLETDPATEEPKIADTATPEPTVEETIDLPTATAEVVTEAPVEIASVDMGNGFYLTYDSTLWYVDAKYDSFNPLVLNEDSRCQIYYQAGHGMDPNRHGVETSIKEIGQTEFIIDRWFLVATGETIVYVIKPVENQLQEVMVDNLRGEPLSDYCIEQAEEVMRLSEVKGFLP